MKKNLIEKNNENTKALNGCFTKIKEQSAKTSKDISKNENNLKFSKNHLEKEGTELKHLNSENDKLKKTTIS